MYSGMINETLPNSKLALVLVKMAGHASTYEQSL